MSARISPNRPRAVPGAARLAGAKGPLVGWMTGWAFFTFSSGAVFLAQQGMGGLEGLGRRVFEVADRVPPYAKLSFGLLFLLLLFAAGRVPGLGGRTVAQGAAAGFVSAVLVLCAAPFDYFTGAAGSFALGHGEAVLPHLAAGALAGLVYAAARRRSERRSERAR